MSVATVRTIADVSLLFYLDIYMHHLMVAKQCSISVYLNQK